MAERPVERAELSDAGAAVDASVRQASANSARATRLGSPRLVLILGALSAFGPLSIDMYLPALPALGRDFAAPASQTELTLSACLLGLALGQVIAGPISDTLGRRRPLLVGLTLYALASLLCVVAPSVDALIALRFVQGLAGTAPSRGHMLTS